MPIELGETAHQGRIVAERPVPVQFDEILEAEVDVVEQVRPIRVARELSDLPSREVGEDLLADLPDLPFQLPDLFLDALVRPVVEALQLLEAVFEELAFQ